MKHCRKLTRLGAMGMFALIVLSASPAVSEEESSVCNRIIKAQVIALDQPWMWNRLGAAQPGGMIYALAGDVVLQGDVSIGGGVKTDGTNLTDLPDPSKLSAEDREKLTGHVRL